MSSLNLLSHEQKEFWNENGYIKLSGIFSEELLNQLIDDYDDLFDRLDPERIQESEKKLKKDSPKRLRSIYHLETHSAIFLEVIRHPKLLDVLEDLMETKNILLHHTRAVIKPPEKGTSVLMHQDYRHMALKNHSMVTIIIYLDDINFENGGLMIYPGSHKLGILKHFQNSEVSQDETDKESYNVASDCFSISRGIPLFARRGEIILLSNLLLHGANSCSSTKICRTIMIRVKNANDEPVENESDSNFQNLVLRGRNILEKDLR